MATCQKVMTSLFTFVSEKKSKFKVLRMSCIGKVKSTSFPLYPLFIMVPLCIVGKCGDIIWQCLLVVRNCRNMHNVYMLNHSQTAPFVRYERIMHQPQACTDLGQRLHVAGVRCAFSTQLVSVVSGVLYFYYKNVLQNFMLLHVIFTDVKSQWNCTFTFYVFQLYVFEKNIDI